MYIHVYVLSVLVSLFSFSLFDLLLSLFLSHLHSGKEYDTGIGGDTCTVGTLLEELYEKVIESIPVLVYVTS